MANETSTGAPLTATVGERLEEKAHEGATPGVERAAAAVEDLAGAGYGPERAGAPGQAAERRHEEPQRAGAPRRDLRARRAGRPRSGFPRGRASVGWAVAAGLGTWLVAGMVGRAFRR